MFEQWIYKIRRARRVLARSFNREKVAKSPKVVTRWLLIIIAGTALTFVALNYKVAENYLGVWFGKEPESQIPTTQVSQNQTNPTTPVVKEPTYEVPDSLVVPKLNINAPLMFASWDPVANAKQIEAEMQKKLDDGVVHLQGTANPGFTGNSAIFGHSSNFAWSKGKYNQVFATLNLLQPGDEIVIYFQKHKYVYKVTSSKTVAPAEVSVLNQTSTPTLSLITCWPPGTTLKRMVITAEQVSPDPKNAKNNGAGGSYIEIPAGQ